MFPERGVSRQSSGGTLTAELHYGTPASITFPITNTCQAPERVDILLFGLYFIDKIPSWVLVSAGKTEMVTVSANPPTLPPFMLGPGQTLANMNLVREEKGYLLLEYAGRAQPPCLKRSVGYDLVIKLSPPPPAPPPAPPLPPPPPVPEKMLTTDPCTQWWLTGERPVQATSKVEGECLVKIRELAAAYLVRVLGPLAALEKWRWAWLPSDADVRRMTIADLLAFKKHAIDTLDGK